MLDQDLKNQLRSVFQVLESDIELVLHCCSHEKQSELKEMLEEVAATSEKIKLVNSGSEVIVPSFFLRVKGKDTGAHFRGIPGGHEFSSLIIAILNSDRKGKMPDQAMLERIRRLKGPIQLKTYISLSCENCPDVVQALNLMALLHGNFHHEMVDGGFVPEEIDALKIQGVPSVVSAGKLFHSGKIQFLDLLQKLEEYFGKESVADATQSTELGNYDTVVIGGGPAGASAAIYSARKGLKTAVLCERIGGQVQDTKGIENFISLPYTEGPQLTAQLAEHMKQYPIRIFEQRRVRAIDANRNIILESGEKISARAIIVTTGAKWRELGVPGEKEYLGRGVAFCPHCDGPFYKGKKVAVIGGGNSGVEAAIDLAGIVKEVVLLEFGEQLRADQVLVEKLKSLPNVSFLTNAQTKEILGDSQKVNALSYFDRKEQQMNKIELDGVFVQIGLLPNSGFLQGVVELNRAGEIIVDAKGRTSSAGIYAAGDVTTIPYKQIIMAMGDGAKAALAAFEDLLMLKRPEAS